MVRRIYPYKSLLVLRSVDVATMRERKPGVWEIRVFTGRDSTGRPTQISRTVRGTKREAQRVAASLESRPPSHAAGRTVTDVLTAWRDVNEPVWARVDAP